MKNDTINYIGGVNRDFDYHFYEMGKDFDRLLFLCNHLIKENERLRKQKTVYKTELKRCVKKLTRINNLSFLDLMAFKLTGRRMKDV